MGWSPGDGMDPWEWDGFLGCSSASSLHSAALTALGDAIPKSVLLVAVPRGIQGEGPHFSLCFSRLILGSSSPEHVVHLILVLLFPFSPTVPYSPFPGEFSLCLTNIFPVPPLSNPSPAASHGDCAPTIHCQFVWVGKNPHKSKLGISLRYWEDFWSPLFSLLVQRDLLLPGTGMLNWVICSPARSQNSPLCLSWIFDSQAAGEQLWEHWAPGRSLCHSKALHKQIIRMCFPRFTSLHFLGGYLWDKGLKKKLSSGI